MFGHKEVQQLISERFVPLAMDDFYLRRQEDAAGKFFRSVADQGPRKGEGGATRQGRYAFTVDGVLLGYNNNRSPERMIAMLNEALKKYESMAGAKNTSPTGADEDGRYRRVPPKDGAVVKVFTRVLELGEDGQALQRCAGETTDTGSYRHKGFGAAIDHLWIQKEEIAELEESLAKHGQSGELFVLPARLLARIARFHLADNTRGEPPHWNTSEIRVQDWKCVPGDGSGQFSIAGSVHLETADGVRGFEGKAFGNIAIQNGRIIKFDLDVLGDFWGDGSYTRGARPGRNPIGFVFTLVPTPSPESSIPPQGARWLQGYYEADR
ncbi:MAG: hypothetical protein R3F19_18710 [Verrucomicrobiales bacterium]